MHSRTKRLAIAVLSILPVSCAARKTGQVELFYVDGATGSLRAPLSPAPQRSTGRDPIATWGDRVRYNNDVVVVQVHSAYIHSLPKTLSSMLTGSNDVVLFTEVQENAAEGRDAPALTSVVFVGKDEKIPGRLNFLGNLAYGPTYFKGHPLRIKFTLMVLQKEDTERFGTFMDTLGGIVGGVTPTYGVAVSEVVNVVRSLLRAQPDVVCFDFEATLLSDDPEALIDPILKLPTETSGTRGAKARLEPAWLEYGFYALVETRAHGAESGTERAATGYKVNSGFLLDAAKQRAATNYLIFSVTPGQLSEQDATLANASRLNAALLEKLRRSDLEIQTALNEVREHSRKFAEELIRVRAEKAAEKAARDAQKKARNKEMFLSLFNPLAGHLLAGIDPELQPTATTIVNRIRESWLLKYDAAGSAGAAPTPAATSDIGAKASEHVLAQFATLWTLPDDGVIVDYNATATPPRLSVTVRNGTMPQGATPDSLEKALRDSVTNWVTTNGASVGLPANTTVVTSVDGFTTNP